VTTQHHHGLQAFGASAVGSSHPRGRSVSRIQKKEISRERK